MVLVAGDVAGRLLSGACSLLPKAARFLRKESARGFNEFVSSTCVVWQKCALKRWTSLFEMSGICMKTRQPRRYASSTHNAFSYALTLSAFGRKKAGLCLRPRHCRVSSSCRILACSRCDPPLELNLRLFWFARPAMLNGLACVECSFSRKLKHFAEGSKWLAMHRTIQLWASTL